MFSCKHLELESGMSNEQMARNLWPERRDRIEVRGKERKRLNQQHQLYTERLRQGPEPVFTMDPFGRSEASELGF